jgi:hypothetical protein
LCSRNDKIILSFEIDHPKNNVHNQDGNHDDDKVRIIHFFFELTDNDGQNFLAGIVLFRTRNLGQHFFDISKKNDVNQSLASLINDNY